MVTGKAAHDWVISSLNHVREDASLIRHHSEEPMLVPDRRDPLARRPSAGAVLSHSQA